jgi:hypothetical protein
MDLDRAIERQRKPLLRLVGTLFAMLGLVEGTPVERATKPVYLAILRLLRPAESAVRRLIVATAGRTVLKPPGPRTTPAKPATSTPRKARKPRAPCFQLFDPRQRFTSAFAYERPRYRITPPAARPQPRIRLLGESFDPRVPFFRNPAPPPPPPPAPEPDDSVSALRLSRRLIAIKSALDDLPRQAKRYARWQSRPSDKRRPRLSSALRPGRPPGHRKKPIHKVDEILAECDWLARHPPQPDTS